MAQENEDTLYDELRRRLVVDAIAGDVAGSAGRT
jgi:hypothetical protein